MMGEDDMLSREAYVGGWWVSSTRYAFLVSATTMPSRSTRRCNFVGSSRGGRGYSETFSFV